MAPPPLRSALCPLRWPGEGHTTNFIPAAHLQVRFTASHADVLDFICASPTLQVHLTSLLQIHCTSPLLHCCRYTYKGGQMVTYTVPVRPGWCRTFYTMVGYKTEEARQASRTTLLQRRPRRRWVDHLERNEVADGDAVFVHKQVWDA